jgi:hypothetical protein
MRTVDGRVPLPTKPGLGFELSEAALRKYPFGGTKAMEFGWHGIRGQQVPHYATPDFLLTLVALVHFMRPSLRKGAHAALSSAAWQEIRVRSGRDDNSLG